MRPTCLFAGGGTGGHLAPGLAVADELMRSLDNCRIVFVGSGRDIERRMVAEGGYPHVDLPVESIQVLRRNPLRVAWRNWRAYRQATSLLTQEQPGVVVGLGGFASAPLVLAAARSRLPTILLEQNTIPGRANRFLSRWAEVACLSFPLSVTNSRLRCPTIETGNPIRSEIVALFHEPADWNQPVQATLLILGGSQGAEGLNEAVRRMVMGAPDRWRGWRIVHQTGAADCERMRAAYAGAGVTAECEPFFRDMAARYREATLVISRAGATTLVELACAGLPAILVPYPHAVDDHQFHNAERFRLAGAAQVVTQASDPDETGRQLAACVDELRGGPASLAAVRQAMRGLAKPDAAARVVEVLQSLMAGPMKGR